MNSSKRRQEPASAFGNRIAFLVQNEWVQRVAEPLRTTMNRTGSPGFSSFFWRRQFYFTELID